MRAAAVTQLGTRRRTSFRHISGRQRICGERRIRLFRTPSRAQPPEYADNTQGDTDMHYTHILWDWNGTLLNDVSIAIECVNALLTKLGRPHTDLAEYHAMMDVPLRKYYENLLGDPLPISYEECTRIFQENYALRAHRATLTTGAPEMLEYLQQCGIRQYIVSAFEKTRLLKSVRSFGIADYFTEISGDDDIHVGSKSLRAARIVAGIDPTRVLYIGDTKADFITAREVGCDCILFSGGHQPAAVLRTFGCPVMDSLCDLRKYTE